MEHAPVGLLGLFSFFLGAIFAKILNRFVSYFPSITASHHSSFYRQLFYHHRFTLLIVLPPTLLSTPVHTTHRSTTKPSIPTASLIVLPPSQYPHLFTPVIILPPNLSPPLYPTYRSATISVSTLVQKEGEGGLMIGY